MRDALTVIVVLLLFVGGLVLVFWPLRTIVQSTKVRGAWKLAWVGLWLIGFLLGGLVSSIFMSAASRSGSSVLLTVMPVVGLMPIWAVFWLFKVRTRNRPDVESRAEPLGFALGRRVRRLLAKSR